MPELSREEKIGIAKLGFADPVYFSKVFLTAQFPGPVPWVHRGLFSILTGQTVFLQKYGEIAKIARNFAPIFEVSHEGRSLDPDVDRVEIDQIAAYGQLTIRLGGKRHKVIVMPRGSAKTTVAGFSIPLREIVYKVVPFFLYVSEAGPHAKMQLDNVKRELESNTKLVEVFGDLKPELRDSERWAQEMFETTSGIAMCARGRGGQVRGLNHLGERPGKVIVDDLEDKEAVDTEYQRKKTMGWIFGDLIPVLSKIEGKIQGEMNFLGTLLHEECALAKLAKDPRFTSVKFGAYDKDGDLLWDKWMNESSLDTEKEAAAIAGELPTYYLEYHSQVTSAETNPFRKDFFIYAAPTELLGAPVIYGDPAISEKETADDAVIGVCGMNKKGQIEVLDMEGHRGWDPREYVDRYFEWSKKHSCLHHGIEANGFQGVLAFIMREEMFRKKHYFEVTPITHARKKTARIQGILYPRFASRFIVFCGNYHKLEMQLLDFQPAKREQKDDWPDCLAGCVALLDPYAPGAVGDGVPLENDQYEPLEDTWQWAP